MRLRQPKRLFFWTLTLFALWLLLSESLNPPHVAAGLVAAAAVAALHVGTSSRRFHGVRWWRMLAYFPRLFGDIFVSGVRLSYVILHPRLPIKPRLFRYRTQLPNDLATTLLGNSITLTPGTVTVEAGPAELLVHAVDSEATGDDAVRRLESRVSRVFRPERGQR